jgi:hypothetical protein
MSPGSVVSVAALGGDRGAGEPLVGMSPAKTETESASVRTNVMMNRFIDILL